jgi:hypothetical protein
MTTLYTVKVKRPFTKLNEQGETVEQAGWTDLGIANNGKGKGITIYPNFQPLVVNGKVEPIYLFPIEKKEVSNG